MTHIALFLILAIYLLVPIALYGYPHKRMAQFCYSMTNSGKCRRFFCLMLLLGVIYMHFVYYNAYRGEYGTMVSTLLMLAMFSKKFTENILSILANDNRKLLAMSIVTMGCAFVPHLFTLAVTLAMLIVGACFYPTDEVRAVSNLRLLMMYNRSVIADDFRVFVRTYFK